MGQEKEYENSIGKSYRWTSPVEVEREEWSDEWQQKQEHMVQGEWDEWWGLECKRMPMGPDGCRFQLNSDRTREIWSIQAWVNMEVWRSKQSSQTKEGDPCKARGQDGRDGRTMDELTFLFACRTNHYPWIHPPVCQKLIALDGRADQDMKKMARRDGKNKRGEKWTGNWEHDGRLISFVWSGAAAVACRKGTYCFRTTQGRRKTRLGGELWKEKEAATHTQRGREREGDTQPTGTHNGRKKGRQNKTDLAWFSFYWWPWPFIPFHSFVYFFLGLQFSLQQGRRKQGCGLQTCRHCQSAMSSLTGLNLLSPPQVLSTRGKKPWLYSLLPASTVPFELQLVYGFPRLLMGCDSVTWLSFISFILPVVQPRGQSTHACKATDKKDRQQAEGKEMQVWRKQTISPPLCWPPVLSFGGEDSSRSYNSILPFHFAIFLPVLTPDSFPEVNVKVRESMLTVFFLLCSLLLFMAHHFFFLPSIHFSPTCYVIARCQSAPPPVSSPFVIIFFLPSFDYISLLLPSFALSPISQSPAHRAVSLQRTLSLVNTPFISLFSLLSLCPWPCGDLVASGLFFLSFPLSCWIKKNNSPQWALYKKGRRFVPLFSLFLASS